MPRFLYFTNFFWIPFPVPRASPLKPHLTHFKSHTQTREAPASIKEHWHPLTLHFIFNMLNWHAIDTSCATLDDQEGFKCTIYLRSWTKEPPNTCLVLDSLCSSTDMYVPVLHQLCPHSKVARLLFCSVLAVQCAARLNGTVKKTQRADCTHWNKSKLSTLYFLTHTLMHYSPVQ